MRLSSLLAVTVLTSTLTVVGAAPPAQLLKITIETEEVGSPISPYIYGQFIEHLGRCIYGGLWAEMLEDRKFYYPIDGRTPVWILHKPDESSWAGEGHPYELMMRSPWLILGDPDSVQMVGESSYVGERTPRIHSKEGSRRGIYQENLELQEGRAYAGHVVLAGSPDPATVEVSLVWGHGASDRVTANLKVPGSKFKTAQFRLMSGGNTDNGRIEISGVGAGSFSIGAVSLMPADNILGWRRDTVALLKELNSPIYRWPGGNFVSGYDWRDGIGDRDRRPPRKNPAWTGIESNDVGIHEFIDLCREIKAEPFVAINTGLGDVESAAQQVEYSNGGVETEFGRMRADHGHPAPFDVKWWAVGNEMYGAWQLGHMPLSDYVQKHNQVAEAIWAVDPRAQLVGVGSVGEWSRTMLSSSSDHMNLISEHLYWQDEDDLVAHIRQVPERIRSVADAHRTYRQELALPSDRQVPIAMDEWNYWYGPNEYGELGVRYFLQDALGIAAGLHEFFRQSDIFLMANYAQTVNVIGAIKTTATKAEFETTGLVLKLYRERFGSIPLKVSGNFDPLDVAAAWTKGRGALTIGTVNPTLENQHLELSVEGSKLTGRGQKWVLAGSNKWAYNQPGKPRQVDIERSSITLGPDLVLPPLSVTILWLEAVP